MKRIQRHIFLMMTMMISSSIYASAINVDSTTYYTAPIVKDSTYRFDIYLVKDSLGYKEVKWDQPRCLAFFHGELFPMADTIGNLIWRNSILPTATLDTLKKEIIIAKQITGKNGKKTTKTEKSIEKIPVSIFGEYIDSIFLDKVSLYNLNEDNGIKITRYLVDTAKGYDFIKFIFPVLLKDTCYLVNESTDSCICNILINDSVFCYSLEQLGINGRDGKCEFRIHPSEMLPTYFSYPLDVMDGDPITWSSKDLFIMWLSKHFIFGWITTLCLGIFFIIIVVLLLLKVVKVSCRHKKGRSSNPYVDKLVELRGNIKTSIEELRNYMQVFSIPPDILQNNIKIDKTTEKVSTPQQNYENNIAGSNNGKSNGKQKVKDENAQKQIVDKMVGLKDELNSSFNELGNYIPQIQEIQQKLQQQIDILVGQIETNNSINSEIADHNYQQKNPVDAEPQTKQERGTQAMAESVNTQQKVDDAVATIQAELDKAKQELEAERDNTKQKVDEAVAGIQSKLDEAIHALEVERGNTQQKVDEAVAGIQTKLDKANEDLVAEKKKTQEKVKAAEEKIQAKLDKANEDLAAEKKKTQEKVKAAEKKIQAKLDKANEDLAAEKKKTQEKVKAAEEKIQAKLDKANEDLAFEKKKTQEKVDEAKEEARKDKEAALALKDKDIEQLKQDQKFYLNHFTRVEFAQTYAQQMKKLISIVSELEKAANELGEANKMEDAFNLFKAQAKYNTNLGKLNRAAFDAEVEMISQGQLIYNESGLSKYEKSHPEDFLKKYFFNFYLEKYVNAVVVFAESLIGLHYFDNNLSEKDVKIFVDLRKKIEEQVDALGLEIATVHIMETNKYSDLDIIKRVDVGVPSNSIVGIENCKVSMKGGTKSSNRIKVILQQ